MRTWRRRLALGVVVLAGTLLVLELGFRALAGPLGVDRGRLRDFRHFLQTGQAAGFQPDANLVFRRRRSTPEVNAQGFTDREWSLEREPGETRIICLGASTTESGNTAHLEGSFPWMLELELERRTGRPHRVMNAGISGWTTAEMLIAWFLVLRDYAPDVLVLHEGGNDLMPRFIANFRPDYSHWRRPMSSCGVHGLQRWLSVSDLWLWLQLERGKVPNVWDATGAGKPRYFPDGHLPPATERPFARNMESIARDARAAGARVVFMTMPFLASSTGPMADCWKNGILENDEQVRALAQREGYDVVDAGAAFRARPELEREFIDIVHLSPAGNAVKAELLADLLAPVAAER